MLVRAIPPESSGASRKDGRLGDFGPGRVSASLFVIALILLVG